MPVPLFANNASTTLSASATAATTTLSLSDGSAFPSPTSGDYFMATIDDGAGHREIVKVTARSTNTLTVTRAQESTTARAWASGTTIELRWTAALAALAALPTPPIGISAKAVCWMQGNAIATVALAASTNTVFALLHREDVGRTYTAIDFEVGTGGGASSLAAVALYAVGTDNKPGALLWSKTGVDISSGSTYYSTTFASGTWTTAGNDYKDGSSRLALRAGQSVFVAFLHNATGSPTFSTIPVAGIKAVYGRASTVGSVVQTGWTVASTYPTVPDPFGTAVVLTTGVPFLGLQQL